MLALLVAAALQDPLSHASLDGVAAVSWRLKPVARALESWSSEGFRLSAAPELRELKLDVFSDDRSRKWILSKVADVFDAEWKVSPNGATLTPIKARWDAKRELRERHQKAEQKALEQFLRDMSAIADRPFPQFKKYVEDELAAIEALKKQAAPGWQDEEMRRREKLGYAPTLIGHVGLYLAARMMRDLSGTDRARLLAGDVLIAATHGPADTILPPESVIWLAVGDPPEAMASAGVALQVHKGHYHVRLSASGTGTSAQFYYEGHFEPEPIQEEMAYDRMLAEFAAPRHQRTSSLRLDAQTTLTDSHWSGGQWGAGDWLRALHGVTGIDVVAQALRVPLSSGGNPELTVGAWLESFEKGTGAAVRLEEHAIIMRPGMAWKLEQDEVSEATWERLEQGVPSGFDPEVLTYAAFAGSLTQKERSFFESERPMLSRVSTVPLTHAMTALRAMSSLSASQKAQAGERRAIPLTEFSSEGQALAMGALRTGMLRTGGFVNYLQAAVAPESPLAFFWDEQSQDLVETQPQPGVKVLTPITEVPWGKPTVRRRKVALHLGYSTSASVAFRFDLRRPIP